jgi:hypothetical protein
MVRQRTQTINAIRGHLAEFGLVAAHGLFHAARLVAAIEDEDNAVPEAARPSCPCSLRSCGRWVRKWPCSTARSPGAPGRMQKPGDL